MSQITRPTKQGGATTYQGKVGAGYTTILASEMDDDLDKIYSAWNSGVDGSNIRPGVITGGMLAPGAVGSRELADGGVATVDLADAAVTTPKLADGAVTAGKLVGGGVMGGDLTGSYPNPSLGVIQSGVVQLGFGGRLAAYASAAELSINEASVPGTDASKPSWIVRLDATNDTFFVYRAPPGSASYVPVASIDTAGKLHATLADGSVGRTQLATNAIYGGAATLPCLAGYALTAPVSTWVTYQTLAPIVTRGGNVLLLAQHNLSCSAPTGGGTAAQRWLRTATPLQARESFVSAGAPAYVPLPGFVQIDTPPAGNYTYTYQLWIAGGVSILASNTTQGFLEAIEIG